MADNDSRPHDTLDALRGRLIFRAWRRGFREADLVLGPFADRTVPTMDEDQLRTFDRLLNIDDEYLYAWIIGRSPTPPEHDGPVMASIQNFMREHVAAAVAEGAG